MRNKFERIGMNELENCLKYRRFKNTEKSNRTLIYITLHRNTTEHS